MWCREFIEKCLAKIRNIYNALREKCIIQYHLKKDIRKKLFCAFALPYFFWLFSTENQMRKIEHMYCAGIRVINNLWGWNEHVTLDISQEKSFLDHLYVYWQKFTKQLIESPEGNKHRETSEACLISKSPEENFYKSIGVRKTNFFINRYR